MSRSSPLARRQIEERFDSTVEDTEQKALMLKNADEQTRRLAYAADRLIAVHWRPMSEAERERELSDALRDVEFKFKDLQVEELGREANERLREVECERTFHWPLEFPEVFERRGFDAFVCNPPFMGGSRISTFLGNPYTKFLLNHNRHCRGLGRVDLCAFFFLRAYRLLRPQGCMGLLATNTIAQGDTRLASLEYLESKRGRIFCAQRSFPWPGVATLSVSRVHIGKQLPRLPAILNESPVGAISAMLEPGSTLPMAQRLMCNRNRVFRGSMIAGEGFVLSREEAQAIIDDDKKSSDVVFEYLIGADLNSSPDHSPRRCVIDFGDRSEAKAAEYERCFDIVKRLVRHQRMTRGSADTRRRWWQFGRRAVNLYRAISRLRQVLVRAEVANLHSMAMIPTGCVFSNKVCVFAFDGFSYFALLQSNLHEAWARFYAPTMRTDMSYSNTDCFETFPFPTNVDQLDRIGALYHEHRRQAMLQRQEGLTKTYNRFHDPDERSVPIQQLRALHVEMDNAVAAAYGWTDLDLGHGFHETKQGIRYTISEPARREVLQRLLKLNHERYEEEVRQGLHEKKGKKGRRPGARGQGRRRAKKRPSGPTLFDIGDDADEENTDSPPVARPPPRATRHSPAPARHISLDDIETDDVMAAFRKAARGRGWMEREELLREVLSQLGYQRLGSRQRHTLEGHLRAAIRRKIIEADGDHVRLLTTTMADYELDELRDTLRSVMRKGRDYDREDVIRAVAHHLGFTQLRAAVRNPIKSAITSAIRQGILGYEGNTIWRE
jgi:hypothetical protein